MCKKLLYLTVLVVLLGLVTAPAIATTYYVDQDHTNADDDNAGTSESAPWETLLKACNTVDAGDTVYVKAGTYIDTSANSGERKFQILQQRNRGKSHYFHFFPATCSYRAFRISAKQQK